MTKVESKGMLVGTSLGGRALVPAGGEVIKIRATLERANGGC